MNVRSVPALLAATLLASAVCCTSNVPVGFDSGTSAAAREVTASPAAVEEAVRAVLTERGDSIETTVQPGGTLIRTGRFWIRIEPRDGGTTFLHIEIARYVGEDHKARVEEMLQTVIDRLR
jgi:hypothetical protein